jgi:hypothetical protein
LLIQQVFNQSDPKVSQELEQLREFLAARLGHNEPIDVTSNTHVNEKETSE